MDDKAEGDQLGRDGGIAGSDPLQNISLAIALRGLVERISGLEDKVSQVARPDKPAPSSALEVAKIVFGGWPALGFVFLLLFYSPLRDALNAIPEKVRSADEIGAFGMSLKSTIQREAIKQGVGTLSETIPALSEKAIELLLHARANEESLLSYQLGDDGRVENFYYPGGLEVTTLGELQAAGLVEIRIGMKPSDTADAQALVGYLKSIEQAHPGTNESTQPNGRVSRKLSPPLPKGAEIPHLSWKLTDLGGKAVEVIVSSLARELSGKGRPVEPKPKG